MKLITGLLLLFSIQSAFAQESGNSMANNKLPYATIPEGPEAYNAATVAARMIDGLGFRYYWGTEGLRAEDLSYKPSEDARTSEETIDHILGLTRIISNAIQQVPNTSSNDKKLSFEEKRKETLQLLEEASNILKSKNSDEVADYKIIFGEDNLPFWNVINGPIADALWHVGQVVTFRRASGNPLNPKVNVLTGQLNE